MNQTSSQNSMSNGWIAQLAEKINADTFFKRFNLTTAQVIEMLSFFIGGIAAGFLITRYLKQVLVAVIILIAMLKGLEYFGVTTVIFNWTRMKELTGIGPQDTVSDVLNTYLLWLKTHIPQTISAVVGLLIGIKLG